MSKYINADKLIDEIIFNEEDVGIIGSKEVIDIIKNMPSADVRENIHGEWKGGAFCGYDMYGEAVITPIICSECKYEVEEVSNYCPNCGADMSRAIPVEEKQNDRT